ncbi:MAG: putative quinol monooxygenase [Velocimicrobium sp.]
MIKVVAQNNIKENKTDEFIVLAKKLVQDTRKYDAGCIRYELLQDVKNPQLLMMLEEWEDRESLNKHMSSKHFKDAMALFASYMEKPGEANLYKTLA